MEAEKKRITIKVSSELAEALIQKHQQQEQQSDEPVFKEVFLGEQIEKAMQVWNFGDIAADLLVEQQLSSKFDKKTQEFLNSLEQYENRIDLVSKRAKRINNRGLIAGIIACLAALTIIFFNRKTSEY